MWMIDWLALRPVMAIGGYGVFFRYLAPEWGSLLDRYLRQESYQKGLTCTPASSSFSSPRIDTFVSWHQMQTNVLISISTEPVSVNPNVLISRLFVPNHHSSQDEGLDILSIMIPNQLYSLMRNQAYKCTPKFTSKII